MTGNTKVWRAPLAGLAAVATMATMGLAAGTANAAYVYGGPQYQYPDVTVTLDANGGEFTSAALTEKTNDTRLGGGRAVSKDHKTVTLTDDHAVSASGYWAADGVFDDLYNVYGNDSNIQWEDGARLFAGWYTEKSGGQAVDPSSAIADGTTLYAHWSQGATSTDESEDVVRFDTNGVVKATDADASGSVVSVEGDGKTVDVRLADGDTLAAWQVPSEDAKADNTVFSQWKGASVSSAKAGDRLVAQAAAGTKVTIDVTDGYNQLYKDGVQQKATKVTFDVARGANLAGYQAVDASARKVATGWTVNDGSKSSDYELSAALPNVTNVTVTPNKPGNDFKVVRVYKNAMPNGSTTDADLKYFVASGESFKQTVGSELAKNERANATSLGWFNNDTVVEKNNGTFRHVNGEFFDGNLIRANFIGEADPVNFDFDASLTSDVNLIAGYESAAPYTTIKFDPNYSGSSVISQKIYWGKKIGDQLPSVSRSGYTLAGWYNNPQFTGAPLDGTVVADAKFPQFSTYYAKWEANSKYGVNGLLFNLSRGYATGVSAHGLPTYTNAPTAPARLVKNGTFHGKTAYKLASDAEIKAGNYTFVTTAPSGYNEASWKQFNTTRDTVVKELIAELNLTKDVDIATVYQQVESRLSAEKADQYNQEFAGKLVANTSYPDVNYDDYGTHATEISSLTSKGIVKGYADGTFGYGAPVARVDFLVWIYRAAGSPSVDSQANFSDVTAQTVPNKEFRDAIAWAASKGITKGYADGTFAPYAPIARQDAVAFLYRASGETYNESYADVKFADVTPGDTANHSEAVLWAAHYGIAKGYSGSVNRFGGLNIVVRQDAAAFLARTLDAGYIAK